MFDNVKIALIKAVAKTKFFTAKNKPEILLIAGLGGIVISEVGLVIAGSKIKPIHDKMVDDREYVELKADEGSLDEKEYSHEVLKVYATTSLQYTKIFAPFVLSSIGSMALIYTSHNIMRDRSIALAAAYTAVNQSFIEYRKRVVDKYGTEAEKEIRYDVAQSTVTTIDENGDVVETTVTTSKDPADCLFARYYADGNQGWSKNPLYNKSKLEATQSYWNAMLNIKGHVFINEIFSDMGYDAIYEGQLFGWTKAKEGEPCVDIDFGLYDESNQMNVDFMNGYETDAFLTFPGVKYIMGDMPKTSKIPYSKGSEADYLAGGGNSK